MIHEACSFSGCSRPIFARRLCTAHYQQQRRGSDLRPIGTPDGAGERLTIRMHVDLLNETSEAAEAAGVDLPQWWRQAAQRELKRGKR